MSGEAGEVESLIDVVLAVAQRGSTGAGALPPRRGVPLDVETIEELARQLDEGDHLVSVALSARMALSLYDAHQEWATGIADLERDHGRDTTARLFGVGAIAACLFGGTPAQVAAGFAASEGGATLLTWFAAVDVALGFAPVDDPLPTDVLSALLDQYGDDLAPASSAAEVARALVPLIQARADECSRILAEISTAVRSRLPTVVPRNRAELAVEVGHLPVYRALVERLIRGVGGEPSGETLEAEGAAAAAREAAREAAAARAAARVAAAERAAEAERQAAEAERQAAARRSAAAARAAEAERAADAERKAAEQRAAEAERTATDARAAATAARAAAAARAEAARSQQLRHRQEEERAELEGRVAELDERLACAPEARLALAAALAENERAQTAADARAARAEAEAKPLESASRQSADARQQAEADLRATLGSLDAIARLSEEIETPLPDYALRMGAAESAVRKRQAENERLSGLLGVRRIEVEDAEYAVSRIRAEVVTLWRSVCAPAEELGASIRAAEQDLVEAGFERDAGDVARAVWSDRYDAQAEATRAVEAAGTIAATGQVECAAALTTVVAGLESCDTVGARLAAALARLERDAGALHLTLVEAVAAGAGWQSSLAVQVAHRDACADTVGSAERSVAQAREGRVSAIIEVTTALQEAWDAAVGRLATLDATEPTATAELARLCARRDALAVAEGARAPAERDLTDSLVALADAADAASEALPDLIEQLQEVQFDLDRAESALAPAAAALSRSEAAGVEKEDELAVCSEVRIAAEEEAAQALKDQGAADADVVRLRAAVADDKANLRQAQEAAEAAGVAAEAAQVEAARQAEIARAEAARHAEFARTEAARQAELARLEAVRQAAAARLEAVRQAAAALAADDQTRSTDAQRRSDPARGAELRRLAGALGAPPADGQSWRLPPHFLNGRPLAPRAIPGPSVPVGLRDSVVPRAAPRPGPPPAPVVDEEDTLCPSGTRPSSRG